MIGAPLISAWSLANAINEPVNDTAPINAPTTASTFCVSVSACSGEADSAAPSSALAPIAAADPPPMPLYSATICGMLVIATFLPLYQAAAVLSAMATKINAAFSIRK